MSLLTQLLEASLSATSLCTYRMPWYLYRHFQADKLQIQALGFPHRLAGFCDQTK